MSSCLFKLCHFTVDCSSHRISFVFLAAKHATFYVPLSTPRSVKNARALITHSQNALRSFRYATYRWACYVLQGTPRFNYKIYLFFRTSFSWFLFKRFFRLLYVLQGSPRFMYFYTACCQAVHALICII